MTSAPDSPPAPSPSPDGDREWRRRVVDETRASTELEGGRSSDAVHALQERWVAGEMTLEEFGAEIERLHPSRNDS